MLDHTTDGESGGAEKRVSNLVTSSRLFASTRVYSHWNRQELQRKKPQQKKYIITTFFFFFLFSNFLRFCTAGAVRRPDAHLGEEHAGLLRWRRQPHSGQPAASRGGGAQRQLGQRFHPRGQQRSPAVLRCHGMTTTPFVPLLTWRIFFPPKWLVRLLVRIS